MNIDKYTENAQGAIIDCQNIAIEEGHQQIDGEHLHLALLMQKDGLIPKLLKFMGVNTGEMIGELEAEIDKLPKVSEARNPCIPPGDCSRYSSMLRKKPKR